MQAATRFDSLFVSETTTYLSGVRSWRADLRPSYDFSPAPTWDRAGISALVSAAKAEFERAAGFALPHNLANDGQWVEYAWGRRHAVREYDAIGEAARLAGFLRHAPQFPALVRLIERATSPRGINTPATTLSLGRLSLRWSPGAAERQIRAVTRRANEILAPAGARVSYAALAAALMRGPRTVGKAAVFAAAVTLKSDDWRIAGYRDARQWLAEHLATVETVRDTSDGVTSILSSDPVTYHGITITRAVWEETRPFRRVSGWLVRRGSETYHATGWLRAKPRDLAREAIDAWKRRRDAERAAGLPDPARVTVLVTRDDSRTAGNCAAGTARFIESSGWSARWYVPASWLLDSHNQLAINAAKASARIVREQMAA